MAVSVLGRLSLAFTGRLSALVVCVGHRQVISVHVMRRAGFGGIVMLALELGSYRNVRAWRASCRGVGESPFKMLFTAK